MTWTRAPLPYFGGKSRVADEVWRRLGPVGTYIEPFFGSEEICPGVRTSITPDEDCDDGREALESTGLTRQPAAVIRRVVAARGKATKGQKRRPR